MGIVIKAQPKTQRQNPSSYRDITHPHTEPKLKAQRRDKVQQHIEEGKAFLPLVHDAKV